MLEFLMSRVLPAPESPTADLYFVNACRDLLGRGVIRLAPTVFASSRTCLVMRHARGAGVLPPGRRLVFFLDDLPEAGIADRSLPYAYRQKLRLVERPALARLRGRADLVVSSPGLARALGCRARVIDPYWSESVADQRHFDDMRWTEIAFLGSAVHRGGLGFLVPLIRRVLAACPRARFHLAERHRPPPDLSCHGRVRRIPGRGWAAYRAGLAGRRFHIALYPLADTPFNMARSRNKLIEHGVVGAAPIYSLGWEPGAEAVVQGAGLALTDCPDAWVATVARLVGRRDEARALATRAGALARRLNDPAPQRALWSELLELGAHAAA